MSGEGRRQVQPLCLAGWSPTPREDGSYDSAHTSRGTSRAFGGHRKFPRNPQKAWKSHGHVDKPTGMSQTGL